jgi:hypothetical protein
MDHGLAEPEKLGWVAWILGRKAQLKIIRDADLEAASSNLPAGAAILRADPNGDFVVYESPAGALRIRFRACAAWLPNEPTVLPNNTRAAVATVTPDGQVLVLEGVHRTRAVARERVILPVSLGGVENALGWLDFAFDAEAATLSESSVDRSGPWRPIQAK